MNKDKYIAFKCLECGKINVFNAATADGHKCMDCNGHLIPIGYAGIDLSTQPDRTAYIHKEFIKPKNK